MDRRRALVIAAVTAAVTLTGAAAVALNVGLLAPRPVNPAGDLQPVATTQRPKAKTVVVRPKSAKRQVKTVQVPRAVPAGQAAPMVITVQRPAAAVPPADPSGGEGYDDDADDDDAYEDEAYDDEAEHEDEDVEEVEDLEHAEGPEDSEDPEDPEHDGAEDDD